MKYWFAAKKKWKRNSFNFEQDVHSCVGTCRSQRRNHHHWSSVKPVSPFVSDMSHSNSSVFFRSAFNRDLTVITTSSKHRIANPVSTYKEYQKPYITSKTLIYRKRFWWRSEIISFFIPSLGCFPGKVQRTSLHGCQTFEAWDGYWRTRQNKSQGKAEGRPHCLWILLS